MGERLNVRRLAAQSGAVRGIGYAVVRARARIARPGPPPRVLVNSYPKSGTHLLTTALEQLPDMRYSGILIVPGETPQFDWDQLHRALAGAKHGQYVVGHLWPEPEVLEILDHLEYRTLVAVRDPRDVVISMAMYASRNRRHPHHRRYTSQLKTDADRILATIEGFAGDAQGPGAPEIGPSLYTFAPWLAAGNALVCRFEELIGEQGGGSRAAQLAVIRRIADYVGRSISAQSAERIADRTWSSASTTFRRGAVGEWRERFDARHHDAFARQVDDAVLTAYGYEPARPVSV